MSLSPSCHFPPPVRPRFRYLVGEDGIFHALSDAASIPFSREVVADTDREQPLMNPFFCVALFQICLKRAVNDQLQGRRLFDTLRSDAREPELEGGCPALGKVSIESVVVCHVYLPPVLFFVLRQRRSSQLGYKLYPSCY